MQSKKELEPEQPELHLLMKNKKIYDEFYKEIKDLFQIGLNYKNQYYIILNHYKNNKKLKFIGFNLNLPQECLENISAQIILISRQFINMLLYPYFLVVKENMQKIKYFLKKPLIWPLHFIIK